MLLAVTSDFRIIMIENIPSFANIFINKNNNYNRNLPWIFKHFVIINCVWQAHFTICISKFDVFKRRRRKKKYKWPTYFSVYMLLYSFNLVLFVIYFFPSKFHVNQTLYDQVFSFVQMVILIKFLNLYRNELILMTYNN